MRIVKYIGWTLSGLLVAAVAVLGIVAYILFTPERITPIVRQVSDRHITCEHEIGNIELTFFSTFPYLELQTDHVSLVHPMPGAQNDTILSASQLKVAVDVIEWWRHRNVVVREMNIHEARVHVFVDADGATNFTGVFATSSTDTASSVPLEDLRIDHLCIETDTLTLLDIRDETEISLGYTQINLAIPHRDELILDVGARDVCAEVKKVSYADHLRMQIHVPLKMKLEDMWFAADDAQLAVNEDFQLTLAGSIICSDSLEMDLSVLSNRFPIQPVWALVPPVYAEAIKGWEMDGLAQFSARLQGVYSDTRWPLISTKVSIENSSGKYAPLAQSLREVQLQADGLIDLNKEQLSQMTIHSLHAKSRRSTLNAHGQVDDLLGDILFNLHLNADVHLPDFAFLVPEAKTLSGRVKGSGDMQMRLSELTGGKWHQGKIRSDLALCDIHFTTDSMSLTIPEAHAKVQMPNKKPSLPAVNKMRMDLEATFLGVEAETPLQLQVREPILELETGNIFSRDSIPQAKMILHCAGMDGFYTDIRTMMNESRLEMFVTGGQKVRAKLQAQNLSAQISEDLQANIPSLSLEAGARYNKQGENALLKWNPRLKIDLKNGELALPTRLPEIISIPSIEFSYSNREMTIDNSRIEIGNSDISLKGNIRHIGKWLRHQKILEGELDVVSSYCDANQLLSWFSSQSGSEETVDSAKISDQQVRREPFLVPTDVNLALTTHMQEVAIFNQVAKNLKGGLYVKDGAFILDEMGFVCHAAKLQLTAMYRTPRRNHLYLGIDYHMTDVDVEELLKMIPNLNEMMPMLSSFKGAAQFHLAVETYLNSQYEPKMSTLRGAASLSGKDMVVMDSETFDKMADLLNFNKKTENRIDSINAELTVYKNEIDVYPLCVHMDNYLFALGGRHNTNMTFNYDVNVLYPLYLGVNISGDFENLKIKLTPQCKFAKDFKPHLHKKADSQSQELRQRIKNALGQSTKQ